MFKSVNPQRASTGSANDSRGQFALKTPVVYNDPQQLGVIYWRQIMSPWKRLKRLLLIQGQTWIQERPCLRSLDTARSTRRQPSGQRKATNHPACARRNRLAAMPQVETTSHPAFFFGNRRGRRLFRRCRRRRRRLPPRPRRISAGPRRFCHLGIVLFVFVAIASSVVPGGSAVCSVASRF